MASLFQIRKSKRFNYKPRFYNEREELREERHSKIRKEVEAEKSGKSTGFSREDSENYIKFARKAQKKSNLRLLLILIILLLLSYLFLYK